MKIVALADHPQHIPELAKLHQPQWQAAHPGWETSDWEKEFRRHGHTLPCTLLALDENGELLGSASLVEDDTGGVVALSPWLANVLVLPVARGKGCGALLIRAIEAQAARLGQRSLYLFTEDQRDFYERRGWQPHSVIHVGNKAAQLMQRSLTSAG